MDISTLKSHGAPDTLRLSDLKSHDEIQRTQRENDPEYAAEADRVALADAVSVAVVHYRTAHRLTQTEFAKKLGWKQPHVARLERGDITPSLESIQRLARAGVIEVHIQQTDTVVRELALA